MMVSTAQAEGVVNTTGPELPDDQAASKPAVEDRAATGMHSLDDALGLRPGPSGKKVPAAGQGSPDVEPGEDRILDRWQAERRESLSRWLRTAGKSFRTLFSGTDDGPTTSPAGSSGDSRDSAGAG